MIDIYPWQQHDWQNLVSRYRNGKLPHAMLFTGIDGLGKIKLALQFSSLLLCETFQNSPAEPNDNPCGKCQPCKLNKAGTHPDQLVVQPEAEGKIIPVDKIREISHYLGLTPQYGKHQVVILSPAEKMNKFAANSLLKTLEEPTKGSFLILISSQPSLLLPTIRSRCQTINVRKPSVQEAQDWLQARLPAEREDLRQQMVDLANGSPLKALEFMENNTHKLTMEILQNLHNLSARRVEPGIVAKNWSEMEVRLVLQWLIMWTTHMIRLKFANNLPDTIQVAYRVELQKIAATVDLRGLFIFLDKLTEARRLLESQVNVQLLLEDLLLNWNQLSKVD